MTLCKASWTLLFNNVGPVLLALLAFSVLCMETPDDQFPSHCGRVSYPSLQYSDNFLRRSLVFWQAVGKKTPSVILVATLSSNDTEW